MQVPLHLLCDDLLLYQEATGNMYKLNKGSDMSYTDLSQSPKKKVIISKHLDLRRHESKPYSTAIHHTTQ